MSDIESAEISVELYNGELDEILTLENASFSDPWTKGMFEDALENSSVRFYIARHSEEICGYLAVLFCEPEAEILSIAVARDKRRLGVASALLDRFYSDEMIKGVDAVFLEVRESNLPARGLYHKYGYEEIGIRKNYYRFPRENAIIMMHVLMDKGH